MRSILMILRILQFRYMVHFRFSQSIGDIKFKFINTGNLFHQMFEVI